MTKYNIMCAKPYTTKTGENKTRWTKLGSCVMMEDGKMFGDIDCIPTGAWFDGSIQFFVQEGHNQAQQPQQGSYQQTPAQPSNFQTQQQHTQYQQPQQQQGQQQSNGNLPF